MRGVECAPTLGVEVILENRLVLSLTLVCALCLVLAGQAAAEERYALLVGGASGGGEYLKKQTGWLAATGKVLRERLQLPNDHIVELVDDPDAARSATRKNVEGALGDFRSKVKAGDVLLIVLFGHGTFDGAEAKFNLVGPDLSASEWSALLKPIAGQVVFVNTTSASFPFLERLSGARRVVITATDSVAQKYETIFPEFFSQAFEAQDGDLDKDGRISLWEAFTFTSLHVKEWYEQRGQLSTERPLLDDTGDGVGKQAGDTGRDGSLASRTFLDAGGEAERATNPALAEFVGRRNILESELEDLKRKRGFMPQADYEKELERILVSIARVSREIRTKGA